MRYLSENFFFGGIPGMFVHMFQIILNFMYVCQSVSWLTFLLKLDKFRDISSSVWKIFLKFFGGIPCMFVHLFQIVLNFLNVCQSVSRLPSLLKLDKCRDITSSGWDTFLIFSSTFSLWGNAELYILVPSPPFSLFFFFPFSLLSQAEH